MLAVWDWETLWGGENLIPLALTHTLCNKPTRPVYRCGDCHRPVKLHEVSFQVQANMLPAESPPARFQRRSPSTTSSASGVDRRFFHVLDIIGDRWTGLVIASLYFGLNRYDQIADALGIATNILSDRLKLLVAAEVLQRVPYRKLPTRYEYRLTQKGIDLYANVLQLHEWSCRWLLDGRTSTVALQHDFCGSELRSEMVCNECEELLAVSDVHFDSAIVEAF